MAEIFLMEDTAALRRIVTRYLRDAGHNVTGFDNGVASIDADMLDGADILVTDLSMPDVDGRQVLKNVRAICPELPVIIITGEEVADDPLIGHADGFLQKPFDESALLEMIDHIMRKAGALSLETLPECESHSAKDDGTDWPYSNSNDADTVRPAAFCLPTQDDSLLFRLKNGLAKIFGRRG